MPNCPLLQSTNQNIQFSVRAGHSLDLEVEVYNAESRPFDNFTSLLWEWSSSDETLLPTPRITALAHHDRGAIMNVRLSRQAGVVVVMATSNSHIPRSLMANGIQIDVRWCPAGQWKSRCLML